MNCAGFLLFTNKFKSNPDGIAFFVIVTVEAYCWKNVCSYGDACIVTVWCIPEEACFKRGIESEKSDIAAAAQNNIACGAYI